tara:strand:+ start:137 stop:724 length:588 start_codon:yes stop_codon:yes gene_type:complete
MKRLLLIFILTFSFQILTKADDIRDFEIEGMSIGDSILKYYNREDLNKFYKISYPNSDKYIGYEIPNQLSKIKFENYESITLHFKKNDTSMRVVAVSGIILYPNNLTKCLRARDLRVNEIKKSLTKYTEEKYETTFGEDKISRGYMHDLIIDEGSIRISCTNWSEEVTKNKEWEDDLNIAIDTKNFIFWVDNKAY